METTKASVVPTVIEGFGGSVPALKGATAVEQSRAMADVQAMVVSAKMYPRDETAAVTRIVKACERRSLAEKAVYAYPRGGQTVSGASIRLMEVIAQNWGSIHCGVKEMSQDNGESQMIAFAWDAETNFRDTKEFVVKHSRDTKQGRKALTDDRDIYEITANMAARRKRACLQAVIPKDVVDRALDACKATMAKTDAEIPMADRIRNMVQAFSRIGVSQELIEKRLGHKVDACVPDELMELRQVLTTIADGAAKRDDFFELGGPAPTSEAAASLNDRLKTPPPANDAKAANKTKPTGGA